MREINLNKKWSYYETENEFALRAREGQVKELDLPHDAMLEHPAFPESKNSGMTGYRDGHVGHYKKQLYVPEEWREKTSLLKFEGVYTDAVVFVNNTFAGKCHYGYNTFYVPLDRHVKYGAENEIHVIANNSGMRNSRWYSGGGIYRDVYLVQGGKVYFKEELVQVWTEALSEDQAILKTAFTLVSRLSETAEGKVHLRIRDREGQIVRETICPVTLFEGETKKYEKRMTVDYPACWSDEDPALYTLEAELVLGEKSMDQTIVEFGIRTITIDGRHGLRVNGRPVKLRGTCIHHDHGIIGAMGLEEAEVRRLTMMKQAGFNAVRVAHHPAGQSLLRACDKVGLYVMDETFDMWYKSKNDFDYSRNFDDDWRYTIKMMALKDFNHPSVILYSLGNEIPESGNPDGIAVTHAMTEELRKYDNTRFVTEGINGVFTAGADMPIILQDTMDQVNQENIEQINDFMTVMRDHLDRIVQHPIITKRLQDIEPTMDLLGYNYMASRYEMDGQTDPDRVVFGSETYPPAIRKEWDVIEACPHVIGEFTWTGWDYLGEAGIGVCSYSPETRGGKWPVQLAYCGDFDITGYRRPISYLREIVFTKTMTPYLCVQDPAHYGVEKQMGPWTLTDAKSCWNFDGCEGNPVVVEVYSAADEVELFLNGKSQGKKACGKQQEYMAFFDISYEPGLLEAVSYQDGKEVGRYSLKSASAERHLVVEREQDWGEELIFVRFSVQDEEGNLAADCQDELSIETEGAELLGFGSADYAPLYDYKDTTTKLFEGRAQAIFRRNGEEGGLRIRTSLWGSEKEFVL